MLHELRDLRCQIRTTFEYITIYSDLFLHFAIRELPAVTVSIVSGNLERFAKDVIYEHVHSACRWVVETWKVHVQRKDSESA